MVQQLKLYDNCYNVEIFYNGPCSEPYEFLYQKYPWIDMQREKKVKFVTRRMHSFYANLLCFIMDRLL